MQAPLRIGTRGSALARWQAEHVATLLRPIAQPRSIELVEIQTTGDKNQVAALAALGGQGAFTKEIQNALLTNQVDLAVHSLKDLPTEPVDGLVLAATPVRGPTGDAFIGRVVFRFADLPVQARVATSSLRRKAQLLHRRPDLRIEAVRGNVDTRLRKLHDQELDGLILAVAGLERLGLAHVITEELDRTWMVPAVGQGALGLECRRADVATLQLLAEINHADTSAAVMAERAFLRALGGGCLLPIGAEASITANKLMLRGVVIRPDGSQRLEGSEQGASTEPEGAGVRLAESLLQRGARQLFENC